MMKTSLYAHIYVLWRHILLKITIFETCAILTDKQRLWTVRLSVDHLLLLFDPFPYLFTPSQDEGMSCHNSGGEAAAHSKQKIRLFLDFVLLHSYFYLQLPIR